MSSMKLSLNLHLVRTLHSHASLKTHDVYLKGKSSKGKRVPGSSIYKISSKIPSVELVVGQVMNKWGNFGPPISHMFQWAWRS